MLLPGEGAIQYSFLHKKLHQEIGPCDTAIELLIHDLIHISFDIQHYRSMKACITSSLTAGLRRVIAPMLWNKVFGDYQEERLEELISGWARGDSSVVAVVKQMLEDAELDDEAVLAETFAARLDEIERIDRMIASAEKRRNGIWTEIERHRESLARRSRGPVEEINEADYQAGPRGGPEQAK